MKLNVYNPNGYRLDATRLTYNVLVGDSGSSVDLATGVLDSQFTVQSGDSTTVTIPVSFTYAGHRRGGPAAAEQRRGALSGERRRDGGHGRR